MLQHGAIGPLLARYVSFFPLSGSPGAGVVAPGDRTGEVGRAARASADLRPALSEELPLGGRALHPHEDDVPQGELVLLADRVHEHGREHRPVGADQGPEQPRVGPLERADHVGEHDAARAQPAPHQPEELVGRQVEGDRVGEVGVDRDHVPEAVVPLQEAAAVGDVDAMRADRRSERARVGGRRLQAGRVQIADLETSAAARAGQRRRPADSTRPAGHQDGLPVQHRHIHPMDTSGVA